MAKFSDAPTHAGYDVVIVGGGIMGCAAACFTALDPGFQGRILVVERDPTYEFATTSQTNSCIRQQFSNPLNIAISRFAAGYLRNFAEEIGDEAAPAIRLDGFGYLYLANTPEGAARLEVNHAVQRAEGVAVDLLDPAALAQRFPWMVVDDLLLGSHGGPDEGYFDGAAMFEGWGRRARQLGVEFLAAEVVQIAHVGNRVQGVMLADGTVLGAGHVVNAAGPRADRVAAMAGVELPVAPRKRLSFIFEAEELAGFPLLIDPSGVHVRRDGTGYLAGAAPMGSDIPRDDTDFAEEPDVWEEKVWPLLAARVPAFERLRLRTSWVGWYEMNLLDQNAIVGPVPGLENFLLMNGFSGHGLQQAPAMGRAISELIVSGGYRTLDLGPLGLQRVIEGRAFGEVNVI
ncbi:NAD(P)/FAD-dependent oxidoreductase [Oceanibium sediminis]|uniref:NAD(P)/FAD-dependent oxidoreductase n=1 Tax=Oceanibium sediminis TaxID=2026339 RepID=UPI000DD4CE0B|nr:FAD-binding oxidoreductase [Oceanibium sediminis]